MVFQDWTEAKRQADDLGLSVLQVPNGTSVLCVLVDPDADAVDCREAAFEAVNGRPISSYEQFILKVAEKL